MATTQILAAICMIAVTATAFGQPDLSGTYNIATLTPLQRPGHLADKLNLTQAEADEIAA